jgi:metal-responsive CopG/Arc/MetJ family transcriptional regulator
MFGPKIKLEKDLYARVKRFSEIAGYSSVEEFVAHVLEKELSSIDDSESIEDVKNRLKGLGYLS